MKIVPIFGKNFKAIQYTGQSKDEFRRIFSLWHDPEYLEAFFEKNKKDLTGDFWKLSDIEPAILNTLEFAEEFEEKFNVLKRKYTKEEIVEELEDLFEPLHLTKPSTVHLTQNKTKYNWLRIYALKLDKSVFIVTGGAIKLTRTMQERKHTNLEIKKINSCMDYLIKQGIVTEDTIIEEVEF